MFENRNRQLDLAALALAAVVMFLGVSLWTYDRFDPPSTLVFPPSNLVHNSCGWAGAYTANYLLESLGLGAYYVLASLVVLTVLLLRIAKSISRWFAARGGWCRWRGW